jgi:hypothetical protein
MKIWNIWEKNKGQISKGTVLETKADCMEEEYQMAEDAVIPSLMSVITRMNPRRNGNSRLKYYDLMNKLPERNLYFTMVIRPKPGL